MANSRTLLVYALALVVCGGGGSSFWVTANTVSVLKLPVAATGASYPPLHPKHQPLYRIKLPGGQHQQIQETSRASPPSSSSSTAPAIIMEASQLQPQSYIPLTNNHNNAPSSTYNNMKRESGLSSGNSDSGPYPSSGYGYIAGRTLQQPMTAPKNNYKLIDRPSRQVTPYEAYDSITPFISNSLTDAVSLKSFILGGLMTFAAANFQMPSASSFNSLLPFARYFRSWFPNILTTKQKEKEVTVIQNEILDTKEAVKVKEQTAQPTVPKEKASVPETDTPTKPETLKHEELKNIEVFEAVKDISTKPEVLEQKGLPNIMDILEPAKDISAQPLEPLNHEEILHSAEIAKPVNYIPTSETSNDENVSSDLEAAESGKDIPAELDAPEYENVHNNVEAVELVKDTLMQSETIGLENVLTLPQVEEVIKDIPIKPIIMEHNEEQVPNKVNLNEHLIDIPSKTETVENDVAPNIEVTEPAKELAKEAVGIINNASPTEMKLVEPVKDMLNDNERIAIKSRRKRDLSVVPDTDLTELAAMVLSAIQSGECMQRSICMLGSQIGRSQKGQLAFILVDRLIPESVQGNQYFVTLKKALKGGESYCNRFRCRLR